MSPIPVVGGETTTGRPITPVAVGEDKIISELPAFPSLAIGKSRKAQSKLGPLLSFSPLARLLAFNIGNKSVPLLEKQATPALFHVLGSQATKDKTVLVSPETEEPENKVTNILLEALISQSPVVRPRPTPRRPQSILRSNSNALPDRIASEPIVTMIPSVESDMPSLASSASQSSQEEAAADGGEVTCTTPQTSRSVLEYECTPISTKSISFDARIWVCEFERSPGERELTWYNNKDLESFKQEAAQRIVQYTAQSQMQLIPTGTGRTVRRQVSVPVSSKKALYSHPALGLEVDWRATLADDSTSARDPNFRQAVLENEIRNVLVVDPHEILCKLFAKALKAAMPHATITTCNSSEQALELVSPDDGGRKRFDVCIIEERLKLSSGSALIRELSTSRLLMKSVFVGVSAKLLEDGERLKESGADFTWPKPPPPLNQDLTDTLLTAVLTKRGRPSVVSELFA